MPSAAMDKRSADAAMTQSKPVKRARQAGDPPAAAVRDVDPERDAAAGDAAGLTGGDTDAATLQLGEERAGRAAAEAKAAWLGYKLRSVGDRSKQRGTLLVRVLAAIKSVDGAKQQVAQAQQALQEAEGQLEAAVAEAHAAMQEESRQQKAPSSAAAPLAAAASPPAGAGGGDPPACPGSPAAAAVAGAAPGEEGGTAAAGVVGRGTGGGEAGEGDGGAQAQPRPPAAPMAFRIAGSLKAAALKQPAFAEEEEEEEEEEEA